MKKEKTNKLTIKERGIAKLITPIINKVIKNCYNVMLFYANDEMIYFDIETNKPTIDIPSKEDFLEQILNNLKGIENGTNNKEINKE